MGPQVTSMVIRKQADLSVATSRTRQPTACVPFGTPVVSHVNECVFVTTLRL